MLADLQRAFLSGLTSTDTTRALPLLKPGHGAAIAARYGVHRGNVYANARQALLAGFPVTAALGGEHWFDGLVSAYLAAHSAPSGDLQDLGAALPAFLAAQLATTPHRYFADVAALERACQEAMVAADGQPVGAAVLAGIAPSEHPRIVLELHPGLRVIHASTRALEIWRAHQAGGPDPASVDPFAGPQCIACLRRPDHIELAPIANGPAALLRAFERKAPLGVAGDEAIAIDHDLDLASALHHLFSAGYVCGFSLAKP